MKNEKGFLLRNSHHVILSGTLKQTLCRDETQPKDLVNGRNVFHFHFHVVSEQVLRLGRVTTQRC